MFELVIRNGTVVNRGGKFHGDVGVAQGKIVTVGQGLPGKESVDATGCYVIPGAVDPHVHLEMALAGRISSDDFAQGSIAAACGGTTTVIDFVDPQPEQGMTKALEARRAQADGRVAIDYGLHMTVPAWHAAENARMREMPELVSEGVASFKMYQAYPNVMLDDVSLLRGMQAVKAAGGLVVLHSETGPVLDMLRAAALAEGNRQPIWHAHTRPARLEATAVHRAAELAYLAGCPLYIFHVGCKEVVDEIAAARQRGVTIFGESCPQYLLLDAETHLGGPQGELYVCAPPLRTRDDQEALWQALADHRLAVVSTDHCPWRALEKQQSDFSQIPGGVPSIEARLALIHHFGVGKGKLSLERWVAICCSNPAQLLGLGGKGQVAPGYDADLVIFDPYRSTTIEPESLHEQAGWTPYHGITVQGWPRTVLVRGEAVVEDGVYTGRRPGRFVPRYLDPSMLAHDHI
jgi:dihydropyrimidinase